jgi:hypothetical protein
MHFPPIPPSMAWIQLGSNMLGSPDRPSKKHASALAQSFFAQLSPLEGRTGSSGKGAPHRLTMRLSAGMGPLGVQVGRWPLAPPFSHVGCCCDGPMLFCACSHCASNPRR